MTTTSSLTSVSDMPAGERAMHHDPNKERYVSACRWRRELSIQQAYLLREELDKARTEEQREAILKEWAEASGRDPYALRTEARWAGAIREEDIRGAFAREGIPDEEWQTRLGVGHIKAAATAKDQKTKLVQPSHKKAALLVEAYHGNWSVKELTKVMQARGLKGARRKKVAPPTKAPTTVAQALSLIAKGLEDTGKPIDIAGAMVKRAAKNKPVNAGAFLEWLTGEVKREHPDLTITLETAVPGREEEPA